MPWSMAELHALLPAFLLVLFRIAGLMLAAPFFSSAALPAQFKVGLSVAIALAVFPVMAVHITVPVTLASALIGLIGELMIGLLIGLAITLLFMGIQLAVDVISHQSGMMLGAVFNPMLDTSGTAVEELFVLVTMMVFLGIGGHRAVVSTLLDSFAAIPPLTFRVTDSLVNLLMDLLTVSVELAIRVGGPTIVALLLALLTLGFLSRTMPQLNILTIGFPIKLSIALLVMAMTMMTLEPVLLDTFAAGMDGLRMGLGLAPASG